MYFRFLHLDFHLSTYPQQKIISFLGRGEGGVFTIHSCGQVSQVSGRRRMLAGGVGVMLGCLEPL